MELTEETLAELRRRLDAGETACVWVTGKLIGDLPVRRLLEHCRDYQKANSDCTACPLSNLCGDLELNHTLGMLDRAEWKAGELTLPELAIQTREARDAGNCEARCPVGDGKPDERWPCWNCPCLWLREWADYWRHTEDELTEAENGTL